MNAIALLVFLSLIAASSPQFNLGHLGDALSAVSDAQDAVNEAAGAQVARLGDVLQGVHTAVKELAEAAPAAPGTYRDGDAVMAVSRSGDAPPPPAAANAAPAAVPVSLYLACSLLLLMLL